jgi:hypothetical protein
MSAEMSVQLNRFSFLGESEACLLWDILKKRRQCDTEFDGYRKPASKGPKDEKLQQKQITHGRNMMKKYLVIMTCLVAAVFSLSFAAENTFLQFNSDVEKAYAAYRKALFQTNRKDAEKSEKANEMFIQQWKQIKQTYSAKPPEVFSSDPGWESTLTSIEEIAQKSVGQIAEGHFAEAHETLEAIRDELADLRKRNSVIVFSDHINNYHEVMEGLLEGGYTPEKINSQTMGQIYGQFAILQYLAAAIKENAPLKYKDNQQFQQLEAGLFGSLEDLDNALESKDPASISTAINMLKPAYAKLFVNFG